MITPSELFTDFLHHHEQLTAIQVRFLNLLKTYIANNGFITVEKLYTAPFSMCLVVVTGSGLIQA